MSHTANRRAFVARSLLAGLGLALAPGIACAGVARPLGLSQIRVDASPLAAKGAGHMAGLIERILEAELRTVFAGGPRGATRMLVRIDALSFGTNVGSIVPGSGATDALEGVIIVIDNAGGGEIARYPLRNVVSVSSGGAWYGPESEQRRLVAVCRNFAQWVRRTVG